LRVTAPDSTDTITVPATIDTCELQVHPRQRRLNALHPQTGCRGERVWL
jgi:hypothetical protein